MSETKEMGIKTFDFWVYLFALLAVIVVAFYGTLTIASAHLLFLMVFTKQLSIVYTEDVEEKWFKAQMKELTKRMDLIDPYK